jgi:hypothetical protein
LDPLPRKQYECICSLIKSHRKKVPLIVYFMDA